MKPVSPWLLDVRDEMINLFCFALSVAGNTTIPELVALIPELKAEERALIQRSLPSPPYFD
jgi:hypothetical protein